MVTPIHADPVPAVSVVIPVFNDLERLTLCLDALESQDVKEPFEVIVIDNGSDESPAAVVEAHPHAVLLTEQTKGSYAARNTGLQLARGEVLAFTDSDCIPEPNWIRRGIDHVREQESVYVGGRIDLFASDPTNPTFVELWELANAFPQKEYVERFHWAATANLFVARSVFDRVGDFSQDLMSGGDREWGERAARAKMTAVYASDAVVNHPCRRTRAELRKKFLRTNLGEVTMCASSGTRTFSFHDVVRATGPLRSLPRKVRALDPKNPLTIVKLIFAASYVTWAWPADRVRVIRGRRHGEV